MCYYLNLHFQGQRVKAAVFQTPLSAYIAGKKRGIPLILN